MQTGRLIRIVLDGRTSGWKGKIEARMYVACVCVSVSTYDVLHEKVKYGVLIDPKTYLQRGTCNKLLSRCYS
jgi:hypothetical protein